MRPSAPQVTPSSLRPRWTRRSPRASVGTFPLTAEPAGESGSERSHGRRAGVSQELLTADRLVVLTDRGGGHAQHVQGAQEALIRLVLPWNRPVPAPASPSQLIQAAVVAGPGERVGSDRVAGRRRPLGERRPGGAVTREARRDFGWVAGRFQRRTGLRVLGEQGFGRTAQQVLSHHVIVLLRSFADRRT